MSKKSRDKRAVPVERTGASRSTASSTRSRVAASAKARQHRPGPTPTRRTVDRRLVIGVAVATAGLLVLAGVGFNWWRSRQITVGSGNGQPSQTVPRLTPQSGQPLVYGNPQAPTTVDVYEDFKCGHCVEFEHTYGPVLDQLREEGKIKVAYHPMAFVTPASKTAANGFACAAEAGYGPWLYNQVFRNAATNWTNQTVIALGQKAPGYQPSFDQCVTSGKHLGYVESIGTAAKAQGVTSTPTLLVNGAPLDIATLTGPDSLRTHLTR